MFRSNEKGDEWEGSAYCFARAQPPDNWIDLLSVILQLVLDLVQFYVSFHFIAIESNILKVNRWIWSVSKKYVQIDIILHTFLVLRKTCELRTSKSYLSKRIELNGTPVPNPIDFTTFYSRLSCCHQSVAKVTSLRLPKFHNVTMYYKMCFTNPTNVPILIKCEFVDIGWSVLI